MWLERVHCFLVLLCSYALAQSDDASSRTVTIDQGPLRGYRAPEGDLFVFYNIPYATAPTGKDRFKAPLPPPVWITPREAVDRQVVCPQQNVPISDVGSSLDGKTVQEDCLIANVYVPDTDAKNLPVVVIVHGGGYLMGHGDFYTPKNLVRSKKIIAVTFNYRLGAHGFLCLGTKDAPGNAGMKDQVAVLRWVQRNIASFGGNPDDVTIQGYSAGSSAVDLLLLSKTTKGLFHRAIPESGANVGLWSVQIDPIGNAKEFAKGLNFENVDDIFALEEFFKTASYDLLFKESLNILLMSYDNNFVFVPCVERDTGEERFLDDYPVNILKRGIYNKVPMLYGFSNMEGLFRLTYVYDQFMNGMNKKFSDYLPLDLQFKDENEKEITAKIVKEFYFGDKKIDNDTVLEYIDYYTDILFAFPTLRSLELQVEAGNDQIYLYQFSFPFENQLPEGINVKIVGANHCSQTVAVFDGLNEDNLPEDEKEIKSITRRFWLNFMTTGNPAGPDLPAWPAADKQRSPHMDINLPPRLKGPLLPERMRLWDDLYERYYRAPAPPPAPPSNSVANLVDFPLKLVVLTSLLVGRFCF